MSHSEVVGKLGLSLTQHSEVPQQGVTALPIGLKIRDVVAGG